MRTSLIACTLPLLALAACHAKVDVGDGADKAGDGNVHVAMNGAGGGGGNKVSVDVPGFSANVALPDFNLGGHLDLDGIKVAPNTKVGSVDVTAHDGADDEDDGKVRIGFTNSDTPAIVLDHYARAVADAGYGNIARTATSLTATRSKKAFRLELAPQGSGSQGTIVIAGNG